MTPIVPLVHPLNGVEITPFTLPLLLHVPANDAALGTNPSASSQVILTIGQVITAGPVPDTLTEQACVIVFPQTSVPE